LKGNNSRIREPSTEEGGAAMPSVAPDPTLALPPGLSQRAAEGEAIRFATLEIIDQRRRQPLRLAGEIPRSMGLFHRGGLEYRGRLIHVWQFRFAAVGGSTKLSYHLLGVQAKRQVYFSVYPVLDSSHGEDGALAAWIAADSRAYTARERVLSVYRKRLDEQPNEAARHYELALVGIGLGTCFLVPSKPDALYHPGPLDEFVAAAHAAIERAPRRPNYLALAAFLHERLTQFEEAARLYGEASAADPKSDLYAALHADALLFAGDENGATRAASEAGRRARARKRAYAFGGARRSTVDALCEQLFHDAWQVRMQVEGLKPLAPESALLDEHRSAIRIDPEKVPAPLRDLIPLALEWGVGDDGSRGYLTDRATGKKKAALRKALPLKRRAEIQDWLDSLGPDGVKGPEAGAFAYLLEALDEMGI
jgi:tetratricopeptide (TPR) repeat protein